MKTGLFCNYDNHHQDARRAIFEQVLLVKQAENLGFEEAWVSEHHFSQSNLSPSMLLLMAHLAGVTSTIRLGTGAVLLPFYNPIRVAEDIGTLDNLCSGRLMFGIAKGGPFPEQNKHFGVSMKDSRARMLEAIALIQKLLYENQVSFNGQFYQCENLSVYPQPLQKPIPVYIASGDDDVIRYAAENSFGLMGGPPFALARLKNTLSKYREINHSGADQFLLARFFFVAETYDEAVKEALPFLQKFSQKMIANSTQIMQNSPHPQKSYNQTNICYEIDYLLENSIIGDVQTCRDRIKKFQDELNLSTITLKPSSLSLQKNIESLQRYNQEVRNYV
jgi:luciferase family oxidoreductase group 1